MSGKRLYVGNIPFDCSEHDLASLFAPRRIVDVRIITDRDTGRSRGFGFVELESPEVARAAASELDGAELMGRSVRVSIARERDNGGGRRDSRDTRHRN